MDFEEDTKVILDPIHGMIHLDPLAVKIIDTHYFQRLRYIKQLSFVDFVYPGATHTRFAHSIGVYHLARQMIKQIKAQKLPDEAQLTSDEEKCICVAALCHDLGHGPFSHVYQEMSKEILGDNLGEKLKHEDISIFLVGKMFDDKKYELKEKLEPNADKKILLIKNLIQGKKVDEEKKKYMFQIVSNADTGVDVDKWDYFNRDAKACGVLERFQYDRALSVARVVQVNDKEVFELGYRENDAFDFYNMLHTRFTLHRKIYKHKVVTAIDLMMKDAFKIVYKANKKANIVDELKIELFPITPKKVGQEPDPKTFLKLDNEFYLDIDKYLTLTDDVLLKLYYSSVPAYQGARKLIERIYKRQLYKLVDDICVKDGPSKDETEKVIKIMKPVEDELEKEDLKVDVTDNPGQEEKKNAEKIKQAIKVRLERDCLQDEIDVTVVKINYGQGKDNPVEKLKFYIKKNKEGKTLERNKVSSVLPSVFQEYHFRFYETYIKDDNNPRGDELGKLRKIVEEVREQFLTERTSDEGRKVEEMSPSTSQ